MCSHKIDETPHLRPDRTAIARSHPLRSPGVPQTQISFQRARLQAMSTQSYLSLTSKLPLPKPLSPSPLRSNNVASSGTKPGFTPLSLSSTARAPVPRTSLTGYESRVLPQTPLPRPLGVQSSTHSKLSEILLKKQLELPPGYPKVGSEGLSFISFAFY